MDLNYSLEDLAFREKTRRWFETNTPRQELKLAERKAWHHTLYDAGYVGLSWSRQYGGGDATPMEQAIVADEMARVNGPPTVNGLGIGIVGPTIIVHGTEAQKQRYLKRILTAEDLWCQLYSEPNAGSDLASLKTRAEDRGDHFEVTGQKIWTSGGLIADWGLLLARTDSSVPKHNGMSCFLMSMRQPGVEVRPLKQITGSAEFAEVFMTQARVEKSDLVGRLGQGWEIAQTTLSYERGGNSLGRVTRYATAFNQLEGDEGAEAGRPAAHRGCRRPRPAGPDLRGSRGPALRGAACPLGPPEERLAGRRVLDHQTVVYRVREALLRARARDPRALRAADGRARRVRGGRHLLRRARDLRDRLPLVARRHDLLGLVRDPEEHHRRARARPAEGSARRPPEGLTPWTFRSLRTSSC